MILTSQTSTQTASRVAVIGSGLGGLAAACTLAARGYEVVVFEKNSWLGGKAAQLQSPEGFRFDMGPTILTVPSVLERIFAEAGKSLGESVPMVRLDPQWRCFFEDGSVLDLEENTGRMAGKLEAFAPGKGAEQGYRRFMELSRKLHDVSDRFFFWKSVESIKDTFDASTSFKLSTLSDVLSLRMGRTVAGTIRGFVSDKRAAQMLDHFTQYVGSSPYNSPAVLCSIAHMQTQEGIWYPIGGTRAVPEALTKLAESLGVVFHRGHEVVKIMVEGDRVTGIMTDDEQVHAFGAVVSNMDSVRTHRELLEYPIGSKFLGRRKFEPACSGVVLFLGLKEAYDHVLHHDFVFSRDPEEEFEYIYKRGEPAPDPTAYLCCPSRSDPEVAPIIDGKRGEALYVLVHTPYLRPHHDWSRMLPEYRRVIIDKLKRTAGMSDIEDRIVFERTLTPRDIHERYHVLDGAIYGLASHGRFFGAFKPGNRSRDLRGLYLAGGAAHPGPGMPMVMMSGWIAADSLAQDGLVRPAGSPASSSQREVGS
ncbi:MAG: phytoene desaturase [Phycisphaeraceae bacterium]|nr:phytoene desaturase [Phycisphaeraceae bacterium]